MDYQQKYLKYKAKYLKAKYLQKGGDQPSWTQVELNPEEQTSRQKPVSNEPQWEELEAVQKEYPAYQIEVKEYVTEQGVPMEEEPSQYLPMIRTYDELFEIVKDPIKFNNYMGLNVNIPLEGNRVFDDPTFINKMFQPQEFNTRVSTETRKKFLNLYKKDVDDFFNTYVNTKGLTDQQIKYLKDMMILLSLRFQINGFMPEKPVFDSTEKFGKTLGFTKAIGNLCLYRPDSTNPNKYNCNSSNLSQWKKWTGQEIDVMIQNYFKDNNDLLIKRTSDMLEEQRQLEKAPTQTNCNVGVSFKERLNPVEILNKSSNYSKISGFISKNADLRRFIDNPLERGIVRFPVKRGPEELVLIKAVTRKSIDQVKKSIQKNSEDEKLLKKYNSLMYKRNRSADEEKEFQGIIDALTVRIVFVLGYLTPFVLDDLIKFFIEEGKMLPSDIYINSSNVLMPVLLQPDGDIFLCPLAGSSINFKTDDLNDAKNIIQNKRIKQVTIINLS